ncbi:MAG TPA: pirin family protein [Kofleriaceae bacterium]|jgi:hypothetical protein
MKMDIRRANERGHADHGWLDTFHTFSFADYYDPKHMGFSALRVINEDWVKAGRGFGKHPHRDMEILTYVLEGAVSHEDSMGNGSVIRPGDVQRMSAGTGVLHSEQNPSKTEDLHLLQIWIMPDRANHQPGYEQKTFTDAEKRDQLRLVASPDGRDGSVTIHQDATLSVGLLSPGTTVTKELAPGRKAWVQVTRGEIDLAGEKLSAGDGAAIVDGTQLPISASAESEVLVFDLP